MNKKIRMPHKKPFSENKVIDGSGLIHQPPVSMGLATEELASSLDKCPTEFAGVSRRHFTRLLLLTCASAVVPTTPLTLDAPATKVYRIEAIPGISYGRSFLRFCRQARFASFEQAISAVVATSQPFSVVVEEVTASPFFTDLAAKLQVITR